VQTINELVLLCGINYPIPGNDDARRAINLYCELIKQTILDAQKSIPKEEIKETKKETKKEIKEAKTTDTHGEKKNTSKLDDKKKSAKKNDATKESKSSAVKEISKSLFSKVRSLASKKTK